MRRLAAFLILLGSPAAARGEQAPPSPADSVPAPPPVPPESVQPLPPSEYQTTVTALRLPRPLPDVPSTVTVLPRRGAGTHAGAGHGRAGAAVARGHHLPAHAFAAGRPHLAGAEPARCRPVGRVARAGAGRRRPGQRSVRRLDLLARPAPPGSGPHRGRARGQPRPVRQLRPRRRGAAGWPGIRSGVRPGCGRRQPAHRQRGQPPVGPPRDGRRAPSSSTACAPPVTSRWPPTSAAPSTSPARAATAAAAPGASC